MFYGMFNNLIAHNLHILLSLFALKKSEILHTKYISHYFLQKLYYERSKNKHGRRKAASS